MRNSMSAYDNVASAHTPMLPPNNRLRIHWLDDLNRPQVSIVECPVPPRFVGEVAPETGDELWIAQEHQALKDGVERILAERGMNIFSVTSIQIIVPVWDAETKSFKWPNEVFVSLQQAKH